MGTIGAESDRASEGHSSFAGLAERFRPLAESRRARWALLALVVLFAVVRAWIMAKGNTLEDFEAYRRGAWGLVHRRDPYDPNLPIGTLVTPFTYTPFAAIIVSPVLLVSATTSTFVISLLNYFMVFASWRLLMREVFTARSTHGTSSATTWIAWSTVAAAMASLASEPLIATLGLGQINLVLMMLVLSDLLVVRRSRWSGLLIGLATGIKLTPLIFIGYLFITRRYRAATVATVTAATATVFAAAIMWTPSVHYFFHGGYDPALTESAKTANQSIRGVIDFATHRARSGMALWAIVGVVTLLVGAWTSQRLYRAHGELAGLGVTAITGLLVSPISWTHHWIWWIVAAAALMQWARRSSSQLPLLALIAWAAPFTLGELWFVPYVQYPEYDHSFLESVIDRCYVVAGAVFVFGATIAAVKLRRGANLQPLDDLDHQLAGLGGVKSDLDAGGL